MSMSIYCAPVGEPKRLPCSTPSSQLEVLREAFVNAHIAHHLAPDAELVVLLRELIEVWINGRKIHDGMPLDLRERIDAALAEANPQGVGK